MPADPARLNDRALLQRLAAGPASGDLLAREAGQTRAAIWKRVAALREAGVAIDALPGRGYALRQPPDLLDAGRIAGMLDAAASTCLDGLEVAWQLESTNTVLLREPVPVRGCRVLLAERQTGGRGRRGRVWISPLGAQVAMSVSRRFDGGLARLSGLSLVTGIAVAEALHGLGLSQVRLKWPNDLVVAVGEGLRKLGGILVEGMGEAGGQASAVIGIGVNVRMPGALMADVDQPWIDLAQLGLEALRDAIVAALLDRLLPLLASFDQAGLAPLVPRFQALDALAGREVMLHAHTGAQAAHALGIAEDGALRVRLADGREQAVHAGDVSLRPA